MDKLPSWLDDYSTRRREKLCMENIKTRTDDHQLRKKSWNLHDGELKAPFSAQSDFCTKGNSTEGGCKADWNIQTPRELCQISLSLNCDKCSLSPTHRELLQRYCFLRVKRSKSRKFEGGWNEENGEGVSEIYIKEEVAVMRGCLKIYSG